MFKLPQEILDDIGRYAKDLEDYLAGRITAQKFRPLRVPRGIYGQRKEKLFMARVRMVSGKVYLHQLEKLAQAAQKYGTGSLHVTTRQDIQIHHVKIEDTIKVIRELAQADLSPRGGGGNTIRNIMNCPLSGICPKEVFDTSGYNAALTGYLLKNPRNYNLPRKFKIIFDGCSDCCALSRVNDLGFVAVKKDGKPGFKVFCGGGMGLHSAIGFLLEEFIPVEDIAFITESVLRVFDKYGERKNRHKARLRFLVESIGTDEFKRRYREELEKVRKESISPLEIITDSAQPEQAKAAPTIRGLSQDSDFKRWLNDSVFKHKQDNYYYAQARLELGDISSEKLLKLCALLKELNKQEIRTTAFQNIAIVYLKEEELPRLYAGLKELGFAPGKAQGITDIVSCMGALTCNLGICNSRGLALELARMLKKEGMSEERLGGIDIKISGCPNSCGQHPIAPLGFFGATRRSENHTAPFYRIVLGGRAATENAALSKECGLVPARNVPALVRDFLKNYLAGKDKAEDFYAYLERRGYQDMTALSKQYERLPSYRENKDYYFDWGKDEEFSLAGIGPGECGAGVLDMIEADILEADSSLKKAKELLDSDNLDLSAKEFSRVFSLCSRCLLVTFGLEPKNDLEAFKYFKEKFVSTKVVSDTFNDITEKAWELNSPGLTKGRIKELDGYVVSLLNEVKEAYKNMDSSFKFFPRQNIGVGETPEKNQAQEVHILDLKGVRCPMNYVQAKLFLENAAVGSTVEICLDEGEPIQNVPVSLKNDGQEIVEIKKIDGYYKVLVKKLVDN